MKDDVSDLLRLDARVAAHWRAAEDAKVHCGLCPRECRLREGQAGFCRVRRNLDGRLQTLNYGKSVAASEEVIETEAVYHFAPGQRILSLGNIGCMMACDFCQNWETSQIRHLKTSAVRRYSPQRILEICLEHGISMVSWTYNDPVVWHEFVLDTSRLLQAHGVRTLYKSALYIQRRPLRELLDVIDIFSVSLKSLDADFYRRITKGELQPVLDRTCEVRASGRHLEVSQLVIPERNDASEQIQRTVRWVLEHLGDRVPLHFVGFHPAFRYTTVSRTSLESLLEARRIARSAGVRHCYLGNVYQDGVSDTQCDCGTVLVTRYGLTSEVVGLNDQGACRTCGRPGPILHPWAARSATGGSKDSDALFRPRRTFAWTDEINSVHLEHDGGDSQEAFPIRIRQGDASASRTVRLGGGLQRVILSKRGAGDRELQLDWPGAVEVSVLPVLDRAHFPVAAEDKPALISLRPAAATREVA